MTRDAPTASPRVQTLGVFLASEDPPRLVAWYRALGVPLGDQGHGFVGGDDPVTGSVFSVMPAAGPLPAPPAGAIAEEPYGRRRVTLNLRVADLDALVDGLRRRGETVAGPRDYGYGRFAWAHDPDGNVVELWEAGKTPPGG